MSVNQRQCNSGRIGGRRGRGGRGDEEDEDEESKQREDAVQAADSSVMQQGGNSLAGTGTGTAGSHERGYS